MAKLLYVEASPRMGRSASIAVARAFLDEYKSTHPGDQVETIDLWDRVLPRFDGDVINAKYAILHGLEHTEDQRNAWRSVEEIIDEFKAADRYLFSLPMWNFGIPYKLKQYLDILIQPGYTFAFDPASGYSGLVTGRPAVAIYARGGAYEAGTETEGLDYQRPYMEMILGFIGFTDIRPLVIESTLMVGPEELEAMVDTASGKARELAASF